MPYGNQDWAVVLPQTNTGRGYEMYKDRLAQEDRLRRESEARESRQVDMVGDAFKDPDYLSGTSLDPVFRQQLADMRAKYSDMIRSGKMGDADVMYAIQKDMAKVGTQSAIAKNLRQQIESAVKDYTKDKGINGEAIKAMAMDKIFFKDGQLKDPNEIAQENPLSVIQSVMEDNPEKIIDSNQIWTNYLKSAGKSTNNWQPVYDQMGRQTKRGYKSNLYPFQRMQTDKEGALIFNKQGQAVAETSYDVAPLSELESAGVKISDFNQRKVAKEPDYYRAMQDYGMRAMLNSELKSKYPGVSKDSKEADLLRRRILFEKFDAEGKEYSPINEANQDVWRGQMDAGKPIIINNNTKEEKAEQKFDDSPAGRFLGSEITPEKKDGPDFMMSSYTPRDIMGMIGNLKDQNGEEFRSIKFDDRANEYIFSGRSGTVRVKNTPEDKKKFIESVSGTNSVPSKIMSRIRKAISPLKKSDSDRETARRLLKLMDK